MIFRVVLEWVAPHLMSVRAEDILLRRVRGKGWRIERNEGIDFQANSSSP